MNMDYNKAMQSLIDKASATVDEAVKINLKGKRRGLLQSVSDKILRSMYRTGVVKPMGKNAEWISEPPKNEEIIGAMIDSVLEGHSPDEVIDVIDEAEFRSRDISSAPTKRKIDTWIDTAETPKKQHERTGTLYGLVQASGVSRVRQAPLQSKEAGEIIKKSREQEMKRWRKEYREKSRKAREAKVAAAIEKRRSGKQ